MRHTWSGCAPSAPSSASRWPPSTPPSTCRSASGPPWRGRVRAALTELAHDLRDHVELTEAPGGLYDDILAKAPRLSRKVDEQKAEHAALLVEVERLLQERDDGMPGAEAVAAHREAATKMVGMLVRHRQRGSDLTYQAYEVDIGGMG